MIELQPSEKNPSVFKCVDTAYTVVIPIKRYEELIRAESMLEFVQNVHKTQCYPGDTVRSMLGIKLEEDN